MDRLEEKLFREALVEGDISKLKKVSKGDVHNHCGLGMRFSTFNKWAGGNVVPPSKKIDGIRGLDEYLFGETMKYIKTAEDLEFLIEATILEAIDDGVKILEPSIDCSWLTFFNSQEEYFNAIRKIKEKYSDLIDLRPEVGMPKSITEEKMNNLLIPCIDSGLFKSIDLYGDESFNDFERFKEYYVYARKKGLKLKGHAGEFNGPENVRKAIEILDLNEVQHGIGASTDDYLLDLIKERDIRLNVCPSSNFILGAISDIKSHPIRKLFNKGIKLSINTDDLLLFDSGVSEEFLYLYNHGVLDVDELNEIRKMSLR
ncbi:hypothetical protein [Oceanirhabdus seepicola]|uniref:Adenosine deaminase domain-containing protein n=1 Tax=Oceanirhabdus seepicola TaxID=2828781 RepID=A0A9J6P0C1_9CLOT|nr:hypothetical protein [Oceanirhabdus seepicola]MCM1989561.1 hypothetical protein [Oceanirhabdus seepicola]